MSAGGMIIQGTPIGDASRPYVRVDEDVSTEQMIPASQIGQFQHVSQTIDQNPAAQRVLAALNAIAGIALPALAAYNYVAFGDRPCSKPVAGWLYTYAMVSFILGCCGLYINVRRLALAPLVTRANALPAGPEKEALLAQVVVATGGVGCLSCCIVLPLSIFSFFWWIKGNFDVWGTFPRDDISLSESIESFRGCDESLLNGARTIYMCTYVLMASALCMFCAVMATVLRELKRVAAQQRASRGGADPEWG